MIDLLLVGGHVMDPKNGVSGVVDVGITAGRISDLGTVPRSKARRTLECHGKVVIPGVIDTHVHLSRYFGGAIGHQMVARSGVTTCLDVAGILGDIAEGIRSSGAGLTVGYLHPIIPGDTISSLNPSQDEIRETILHGLHQGALGIKLLGGHFPLSPEATATTINIAQEEGAYVAFHAGTTNTSSDIRGLKEAIELADGHPVHMAHINSYCRGLVRDDPIVEAREAVQMLADAANIRSESYLSVINGTSGLCQGGVPQSLVTRACLRIRNYEETQEGLERAMVDDYALVHLPQGDDIRLASRSEGIQWFREQDTAVGVSFPVNSPQSQFIIATARRDGRFVVDAISTDGGGIPRNILVPAGLALVRLGAISLAEFATKTSWNPARMLGLNHKGHLGVGADADVTVLDIDCGRAVLSIAHGKIIMKDGVVLGDGGNLITTQMGVEAVKNAGVSWQLLHT